MKNPPNHINNNRYFLIRHGESLANKRGLIVSHPDNAVSNFGLTSKGSEQVLETAVNTRLTEETLIVSSDYLRARETAEIMHTVVGCHVDIRYDHRLRERGFGSWELCDDSNYDEVWKNDLNCPEDPEHKVESVYEVLARTQTLIDELEENFSNKTFLMVGHGDVLQILLAQHHNMNVRFHRSLASIANAEIRSLAKLELASKKTAA